MTCRFTEAMAGRLWGAAECCREPHLIEQLGRLDLAPEVQPFANAALKVSCAPSCMLCWHKRSPGTPDRPYLSFTKTSLLHLSASNILLYCCILHL